MSELKRTVKVAETFFKLEGATNVIVIATNDDGVSVTMPKDSHVTANLIMFALDESPELTKEIVKNFLLRGGHLS